MSLILLEQRRKIIDFSHKLISAGVIHDGQGNISIFDRDNGLVAITPSAVPYDQRTAEDICILNLDGTVVEGKWKPTSEKALHLVYYQRREDVNAVVHTHAPKATVFGLIGSDPMPMILTEAAIGLGGPVPIAPYGRPGTEELADLTCQAMGSGCAAIMAQHGLITVGESIELAAAATLAAESTAEAIIQVRSMGYDPVPLSTQEVRALRGMISSYKPTKI